MLPEVLHTFSVCSLANLEAFEFDNRTDTKFVFRDNLIPDLLDALNSDYEVLEVNGENIFQYKNIYFDSDDFINYFEHHNGRGNRLKYRTRQYADNGAIFFEVKTKSNKGNTIKERIPVAPFKDYPELDSRFSSLNLSEELPQQTFIHYNRITFLNKVTHQKLTIDFNLYSKTKNNSVSFTNIAIAEVKQLKSSEKSAAIGFFKKQKIRPLSFSKYCISLALMHNELKSNRFKPVIRQLNKISKSKISIHA